MRTEEEINKRLEEFQNKIDDMEQQETFTELDRITMLALVATKRTLQWVLGEIQ